MKKNTHLKKLVQTKQNEHREDVAREVRQYGHVRPVEQQVSSRGWKSYSQQKYPSAGFRRGYTAIRWSDDECPPVENSQLR